MSSELRKINDLLAELLPPLSANEASIEADRCLYCFDAPCTHACPTHIDIPKFIKKIATGNLKGSALSIYDANLLGATCARVCPVQELCEGACVLGAEHKPIAIGRLQRYAMDFARERDLLPRIVGGAASGRVAVIGSGPAGLSCAGELARRGHAVTIFEKRELPGGLSTYGIIALREPVDVALEEVRMIERMGVAVRTGMALGENLAFEQLMKEFDAVVLSAGLGRTPQLRIEGEEAILDGLDFIERSKTHDAMEIGRKVLIIGAGNTAIDCATIAARLGAERVTIVYRRTDREMTCYSHEYEFAKREGVEFRFLSQPVRVILDDGALRGIECVRVQLAEPDASGRPRPVLVEGSEFIIEANQVVKAVGQDKPAMAVLLGLETTRGYIAVDENFETSRAGVYAIGDSIRSRGAASTVMAVQDGKLAAAAIHRRFCNRPQTDEPEAAAVR